MTKVPRIVSDQTSQLDALCKQFRVRRLELFGSALTDRFDAGLSDLDFLVDFENLTIKDAADRYFGLLHALENLFARRIDLVDLTAIENPYFLREINRARTVLYAA